MLLCYLFCLTKSPPSDTISADKVAIAEFQFGGNVLIEGDMPVYLYWCAEYERLDQGFPNKVCYKWINTETCTARVPKMKPLTELIVTYLA